MARLPVRGALAVAGVAATWLAATAALSSAATVAPPGWVLAGSGPRQGTIWQGAVPRVGAAELYLPPPSAGGRFPMVYVDAEQPAAGVAAGIGLPDVADQLIWNGTTPAFATLVVDAPTTAIARVVDPWARRALPLEGRATLVVLHAARWQAFRAVLAAHGSIGTVALVGGPASAASERADALVVARQARLLARHHTRVFLVSADGGSRAQVRRTRRLATVLSALGLPHAVALAPARSRTPLIATGFQLALTYSLTSSHVQRATAAASGVLPRGWVQILSGPAGGTVWQGRIPNTVVPGSRRASLVYLPPHVDPARRYPVVVLLHGLRGSPYSFIGGLRLAVIADGLIARRRVPGFVAVMPPAGRSIAFDGEWTGDWERYVVDDVLPWAQHHLPVASTAAGTAIAGFSAGGYGALDIGLRHPGTFGTLESMSGYFAAPHDGSLAGASANELAEHDPSLLTRNGAAGLRQAHVRVYLAAGRRERVVLAQTQRYASLLTALSIDHRLASSAGGHVGKTWRVALSRALTYALAPPPTAPVRVPAFH